MTRTWSFQPRAGLGKPHPASVGARGLGGWAEDAVERALVGELKDVVLLVPRDLGPPFLHL